jgi:hypothetical protein
VRLPIAEPAFTVSEPGGWYGRYMRSLRTFLVALAGLALPVGLALAVYFSSASTIAATPVALPPSAIGTADPEALKVKPKPDKKHDDKTGAGTTTDDHGGATTSGSSTSGGTSTADHSGSDDRSGTGSSGPGSDDSHSGSGGDD